MEREKALGGIPERFERKGVRVENRVRLAGVEESEKARARE